jgi:YesN/AraC family two-component response regulator
MPSNPKPAVRIVIADDNPRARRGLCAILATNPGIVVVGEASQGEEALKLVETHRPQVALLDVCMPVMDGLQAARAIKNRWPQTRVILISISADHRDDALECGADTFLVKGCPAGDLISTVLGSFLPG